ncbi:MAG: CoA transferase [Deltaproteobacteria bacterium]|nr:CoA transferase [Deltaproteobacteria bacterium]
MTHQALGGLKIIDLSQGVAGPYLAKLFADFGAQVIKLEPPGKGDKARFLAPLAEGVNGPEASGMFAYLNANKQSATLNLRSKKGADLVRRLCVESDVVIESYEPGALDGLGLSAAEMRRENPKLIVTSITWFGQDGPYSHFKGGDALCHALTGITYNIGPKEGPPVLPGGYQAQFVGGVTAFIATMGSILGRANGHGGQHVDVSILEANLCFTETGVVSFAYDGECRGRQGINRYVPTYPACAFPCKGGWIGVNVLTPTQWHSLCDLIGRPDLKDNPNYSSSILRLEHADELDPILSSSFLDRSAEEWFHLAQSLRIPFALVPTMADLLSDTHFKDRRAFVSISHPDLDSFEAPAIPFKLLKTPALQGGASPRLGQHNSEIYKNHLNLSDSEIDQLKDEGVI